MSYLLLTIVVVLLGVLVFETCSRMFDSVDELTKVPVEICRSHQWIYNEKEEMVCAVCPKKAGDDL